MLKLINDFSLTTFNIYGYTYTVSPYAAVWNDDRYYLVGYCEKHKNITVFRIDRIADIFLTESISIPCPERLCAERIYRSDL